jgi:leader peptidase (prepilin peptidase)/N-methyltransferase
MTALEYVGLFLMGLSVGSFLNVVIYRVPRGESLLRPPSHCPSCDAPISPRDNIPVVSWFLLRGKCRHCGAPISRRYVLVEIFTALLFIVTAQRLGWHWVLPAYLVVGAALVALAFIDGEHMRLPRSIVYPVLVFTTAWFLLTATVTHAWRPLWIAAICGAGWFALFLCLHLANPRWMGFGDVRLAALLGLVLGWLGVGQVLVGFFLANLLGAVVGVVLISRGRMSRGHQIPFGIFLALGTWTSILYGTWLLTPFSGLHNLG